MTEANTETEADTKQEEKPTPEFCERTISVIGKEALQSTKVLGALIVKMHENRNTASMAASSSMFGSVFGSMFSGMPLRQFILKPEMYQQASAILEEHIKTSIGWSAKDDEEEIDHDASSSSD